MGIDVYLRWRGMTRDEKAAQITGFSIEHGHVGYLREAYHGAPYATHILVPEAFAESAELEVECGVCIPAHLLRTRLSQAVAAALEREENIYGHAATDDDAQLVVKSFEDFVALCEAKEAETGEPCRIVASY
jgi:hypothetical protein